jgi:hypothetical protein
VIIIHVLFWVWCAALAFVGAASFLEARGSSAEAGGAALFLFGVVASVLLVLSFALRWWLS